MESPEVRRAGVRLVVQAAGPVEAVVQVAVATPGAGVTVREVLTVSQDGTQLARAEVVMPGDGRAQVFQLGPGRATLEYTAVIEGRSEPAAVTEAERLAFLRPSRYAESDRLAEVALAEFAGLAASTDLLAAVSSWVGTRLRYVPGSSGPTDGAVETLASREGVCRDYAHLVIALLRAMDVPARLAAVYAPGLQPMDFHAVAEAAIDGQWRVVDPTLLAPRASMIRIATGRDAADTAFLSTYRGHADLLDLSVTATADGPLPADDITVLTSLR